MTFSYIYDWSLMRKINPQWLHSFFQIFLIYSNVLYMIHSRERKIIVLLTIHWMRRYKLKEHNQDIIFPWAELYCTLPTRRQSVKFLHPSLYIYRNLGQPKLSSEYMYGDIVILFCDLNYDYFINNLSDQYYKIVVSTL